MQVVTTSAQATDIRIVWTAPASNGAAITGYEIVMLQSDGVTYTEEPVSCDGTTYVSTRECDVPMATLRAAPFNLVLGDLVRAKARALNAVGAGPYSQANVDGATIQTVPQQVTGVAFVEASSTSSEITVSWNELTTTAETGDSPITEYELYQAEQAGTPSWSLAATVAAGTSQETATGLTGGVTYLYKVRAKNQHGAGLFSSEVTALAAQVPDAPAAPTTTQIATGVQVSWTAPADQHQSITAYTVVISDSAGTFAEDTTLCDGSGASVLASLYCIIPISSLMGDPYNLVVDTTIAFKVSATNARGQGAFSPANTAGVKAQTVPSQMAAPVSDPAQTGESAIYVSWAALSTPAETGGSTVTSYHLEWDQGTGTWQALLGSPASLATSHTLTTAVVAGTTYYFRVRAENTHGLGEWSTSAVIKAAQVPYQMVAATTAIDAATGGVTISWTAPADGSDAIVEYKVEVQSGGGAFNTEATACLGTDPAVLSGRTCLVPMSTLRAAPHSLAFDALVAVRLSARNAYGWGATSALNTAGAQVRVEPTQMAAPAQTAVTEAQISIEWPALTSPDDGNSAVLAYTVYWDNGGGTPSLPLLDALQTSVSVDGLTGGTTYRFKVKARNIYGAGPWSTELAVLASDLPDQVAIPTVTLGASDTAVTVAWDAPADHAAPIDQYQVLLQAADGTYAEDTATCGAADAADRSCAIPMPTVLTLTGLAVDQLIRAKVRAHNANGWGAYSELNTVGATTETLPTQLAAPTFDVSGSSATQITLNWASVSGTAAGGVNVAVAGYVLEWDAGAATWSTHQTPTGTSAVSTGLAGGVTYQYRVAAENKYGVGPYSDVLSVVAAQAPAAPDAPTTTLETSYIKIAWTAPFANYAAIDAFAITIIDGTGAYVEETSVCDGSDATVQANRYCLVPMTALWAAPFSLAQGTTVTAKVAAHNERGWGAESAANTAGAPVEVVPHQMPAPTRGSSTSDTAIQVDWVAPTSPTTGGSAVLGYALYTDDALGIWRLAATDLSATSYILTGNVTGGVYYQFQVQAKNKWGWGALSSNGTILAAAVPSAVDPLTTAIDAATGGVTIAWGAPTAPGGVPVLSYLVVVKSNVGVWATEPSCDGSDATIVSTRTCLVPMANLAAAPHSLPFDALVEVMVSA
jgi:hypothetical protein